MLPVYPRNRVRHLYLPEPGDPQYARDADGRDGLRQVDQAHGAAWCLVYHPGPLYPIPHGAPECASGETWVWVRVRLF